MIHDTACFHPSAHPLHQAKVEFILSDSEPNQAIGLKESSSQNLVELQYIYFEGVGTKEVTISVS